MIGDQPANSPDQVPVKRAALIEAYWQTTRFRTATTVWEQLEQLKRHRISVHTFYIDDPKAATSAKGMFEQVARDSGGQCMPLDIGSDVGAQTMTDLITERILDELGGDHLVSAYRSESAHGTWAICGDPRGNAFVLFVFHCTASSNVRLPRLSPFFILHHLCFLRVHMFLSHGHA